MSTDTKGKRFCDACFRTIPKAIRVDRGRDYCGTCYKREFSPQTCEVCATVTRHHRDHSGPFQCPVCLRKTRTCDRCGKLVPGKAGMIAPNGNCVCPSCVSYYRTPEPCAQCGELSTRLARLPKYGVQDLICERCQARVTNQTCSVCRRFRRVAGVTEAGKPYCVSCVPGQAQTHPCSECGTILPGSGSGRCRPCLLRNRIVELAEVSASGLERDWNRTLLAEYAQWIGKTRADRPIVAQYFQEHIKFFERLDASFVYLSDLSSSALLAQFSVAELRRYLLPVSFLRERLGLVVSRTAKLEQAEQHRITAIVIHAKRETWGPLLAGYHAWLTTQRVGVRTLRLLLRSAQRFCRMQRVVDTEPWKSAAIPKFLDRYPGHRAGLFKFVTYVGRIRGWDVSMPPVLPRNALPLTVPTLAAAMRTIAEQGVDQVSVAQLTRVLAKSFGYTRAAFVQGEWELREEVRGVLLSRDGESMIVPPVLVPVARAWKRRYVAAADE